LVVTSTLERRHHIPVPNAGVWPGLADVPHHPVRAFVAERLFRRIVAGLPLRVTFPDGATIGGGGRSAPTMIITSPDGLFNRLGEDVHIGFGEAYMVGDWAPTEGTDLADLLSVFAARASRLVPPWMQRFRFTVQSDHPSSERNTRSGSKANIHRHYDLSNDLFTEFLDETMTYSAAWFETGDDLAAAQHRKIDGVLDYAHVGEGSTVLDIGCGWGALAIRAAQRGARVTGLTLSAEQKGLAEERIAEAGVADRVDILLQDYRDVSEQFDAVVSVEMIEAVGEDFLPEYFATIDRVLRPGGKAGLQAITMPHDRMVATRHSYSWINKYIFPGGFLPSLRLIDEVLAEHTSLAVFERRNLRQHYVETLQRWRLRFLERWDEISGLGFDDTFRQMWSFWLAYSEAGFRASYLGVSQLQLARSPFTR